jgi:hypothetical protein
MIVVGVVLLLPGVCVLMFVGSDPKGMLTDSVGWIFIVVCMASTAGGVALIWAAVRRPSRAASEDSSGRASKPDRNERHPQRLSPAALLALVLLAGVILVAVWFALSLMQTVPPSRVRP